MSSEQSTEPQRYRLFVCAAGHAVVAKDGEEPATCLYPGWLAGWCHCRQREVIVAEVGRRTADEFE